MLSSFHGSFIRNVNMLVYSETFGRRTASAWPLVLLTLQILLALVTFSQLSTRLSKTAVTENQHLNRLIGFWTTDDNTLIMFPLVMSVSDICSILHRYLRKLQKQTRVVNELTVFTSEKIFVLFKTPVIYQPAAFISVVHSCAVGAMQECQKQAFERDYILSCYIII